MYATTTKYFFLDSNMGLGKWDWELLEDRIY